MQYDGHRVVFFVELHTALPVDPRWKEGNGMGEGGKEGTYGGRRLRTERRDQNTPPSRREARSSSSAAS